MVTLFGMATCTKRKVRTINCKYFLVFFHFLFRKCVSTWILLIRGTVNPLRTYPNFAQKPRYL
jgi:hypothetical protein